MASSFEKAFTQAYQADVARRRDEEAQIAREVRAAKQNALERTIRRAEKKEDLAELYKRQDFLSDRDAAAKRLETQERFDAEHIAQIDKEQRLLDAAKKERDRKESEDIYAASASASDRFPGMQFDFSAEDWKNQIASAEEARSLSAKLAEMGAEGVGPDAYSQPVENVSGIPVPIVSTSDYGRLAEAGRKQSLEKLKHSAESQARVDQLKDTADFVYGLDPSKRKKEWFSDTGEITEAAVRDRSRWGQVTKEPVMNEFGEIKGYKNVYRYAEEVPPLSGAGAPSPQNATPVIKPAASEAERMYVPKSQSRPILTVGEQIEMEKAEEAKLQKRMRENRLMPPPQLGRGVPKTGYTNPIPSDRPWRQDYFTR